MERTPITFEWALCADRVTAGGRRIWADETKAVLRFECCKAFPNYTMDGASAHAAVIAKSHQSMIGGWVNWEHDVAVYQGDEKPDNILGAVIGCEFPDTPPGGWKVGAPGDAPIIRGAATLFKLAKGAAKRMGNPKLSVSMEALWPLEESGFAVRIPTWEKSEFSKTTPDDFAKAGFAYVPWALAPEGLRATYSQKSRKIVSTYGGKQVISLMGGLDGAIHFAGIAVCRCPAESAARITGLSTGSERGSLAKSLNSLAEAIANIK